MGKGGTWVGRGWEVLTCNHFYNVLFPRHCTIYITIFTGYYNCRQSDLDLYTIPTYLKN